MRSHRCNAFRSAALVVAALLALTRPAPAQGPAEVTVNVFPGGFNWGIYVAQERGLFEKHGIRVTVQATPSSVAQMTGLSEGKFDIAMTAVDNIVAYAEGQGEAPIGAQPEFFAFMGSDTGFLSLVTVPDVKAIADLKGRTLSVDALTTGYAFVLFDILRRSGLNDGDYTVAKVGGMVQRWNALRDRKQDGTMLSTPYNILAKAEGFTQLATATKVIGHYQGNVAAARRSWAAANKDKVIGYIRAYVEAIDWLYERANRDEAVRILRKNVPQMSQDLAERSYDELLDPQDGFFRQGRIDMAGLKTVLELRSRYGKPTKLLDDPMKYYDASYHAAVGAVGRNSEAYCANCRFSRRNTACGLLRPTAGALDLKQILGGSIMFSRLCLGLAALLIFTCGAAAAELTVGFVTSLSGPGASIGIPYEKGILAAQAYAGKVGDINIKLIRLDDASDPSAATRNSRKLVQEDHVDVLMGTSGLPGTIAMAVVAAETKTPMLSLVPANAPQNPNGQWLISIPQPVPLMVAAVVERMKRDNVKRTAYIGFSDSWGDLVYDGVMKSAPGNAIEVVTNERYARADTSVAGQTLKIIAAHPDAVITGGSGTPGALPYLALADRGFKGGLYGTHALINPDFVRVGGAAVEGVIAPTGPVIVAEQLPDSNPTKKVSLAFREVYRKTNNAATSDAYSAYSFDAWLVLLDSAKRALGRTQPGTEQFRAALNEALETTKDVTGTHAVYNFKPGESFGVDERARILVQLQKGKWTLLQ